ARHITAFSGRSISSIRMAIVSSWLAISGRPNSLRNCASWRRSCWMNGAVQSGRLSMRHGCTRSPPDDQVSAEKFIVGRAGDRLDLVERGDECRQLFFIQVLE